MTTPIEPWRKNLYIIWASQFIAMMGMSLVVPFLPFYIRSLGVSSTEDVARWSGLVFAGPFFLSFFLTPVWGFLGDRYGRKLMTIRAVFGLAISQFLIAIAPNVEMLFLFRMVQGAISGFIAAALALVSANTPREKAGYAVGLLQTAQSSGNVIGPLVGGSLSDAIGFRPVFYVVAGLCVVSGIVISRYVQETAAPKADQRPKHSLLSNYRYAFQSKPIRVALGIMLISQASVFMIQPIFALFVESLLSSTEYVATMAGGIFSVVGVFTVISAPWWGKRNDVKSYRKNLSFAFAGAGLSYIAQGVVTSAYQLIFFRATLGFCLGGMLPTLYSYVSKNSSLERRGGIMGIASSFNILANMIGPPAGGLIAAHVGLRQNFFITGALLTLTVFLVRAFFVDLHENQAAAVVEPKEVEATVPFEE